MTGDQYENEAGDQYDRYLDMVQGLPSARNAGWWNDYLPIQRYVMYQVSYRILADALLAGRLDEVADENIAILAWAPLDQEAVDAWELEAKQRHDMSMAAIHQQVYGSAATWFGKEVFYPQAGVLLPKIDTADPDRYYAFVQAALEKEGGIARNPATYYENTPSFFDMGHELMGWFEENIVGPLSGDTEDERFDWGQKGTNEATLFRGAADYSSPPGENEFGQWARNVRNVSLPFAVDALIALKGLQMIGGTIGATISAAQRVLEGRSAAEGIVTGLKETQKWVDRGWQFRRWFAGGNALFGAAIMGNRLYDAATGEIRMMPGVDDDALEYGGLTEDDWNLLEELLGVSVQQQRTQGNVLDRMYPEALGELSTSYPTRPATPSTAHTRRGGGRTAQQSQVPQDQREA